MVPVARYLTKNGLQCNIDSSSARINRDREAQNNEEIDHWGRDVTVCTASSLAVDVEGTPVGNTSRGPAAASAPEAGLQAEWRQHRRWWRRASSETFEHLNLSAGRVAWRVSDDARGAVVRSRTGAAGKSGIDADSCTGALIAWMPLAPPVPGVGHRELSARVSTKKLPVARDLCLFARGDPARASGR
jgi:hypothetical protein